MKKLVLVVAAVSAFYLYFLLPFVSMLSRIPGAQ